MDVAPPCNHELEDSPTLLQPLRDPPYPTVAGHGVFSISCSLPTQILLPFRIPFPGSAQFSLQRRGG